MNLDRSISLALAILAGTTLAAEAQSGLDQGAAGGCTQFGVVMNCQGVGIRGGSTLGGTSTSGGSGGSESGGGAGGGVTGGGVSGECTPGSTDVMCMLSRTFGLSDDTGVSGATGGAPSTGNGSPQTFPPVTTTPGAVPGSEAPSSDGAQTGPDQ